MKRNHAGAVAAGLALLLTSGCIADSRERTPTPSLPTAPSAPEPSTPGVPDARVTPKDVELIRHLVAFALEPSSVTAASVPFAPEIQLGLGRDLKVTLDEESVAHARAWVIGAQHFRAHTGTFSALRLIRHEAAQSGSRSVGRPASPFAVSVGAHPHCAGSPVPAPRELAHLRRVSVQPSQDSVASCLSWFTVDVFVDKERQIRAVTLDVWEP